MTKILTVGCIQIGIRRTPKPKPKVKVVYRHSKMAVPETLDVM